MSKDQTTALQSRIDLEMLEPEFKETRSMAPKYCFAKTVGKPECQISCGMYCCDKA